jgi:hypothetical protein
MRLRTIADHRETILRTLYLLDAVLKDGNELMETLFEYVPKGKLSQSTLDINRRFQTVGEARQWLLDCQLALDLSEGESHE